MDKRKLPSSIQAEPKKKKKKVDTEWRRQIDKLTEGSPTLWQIKEDIAKIKKNSRSATTTDTPQSNYSTPTSTPTSIIVTPKSPKKRMSPEDRKLKNKNSAKLSHEGRKEYDLRVHKAFVDLENKYKSLHKADAEREEKFKRLQKAYAELKDENKSLKSAVEKNIVKEHQYNAEIAQLRKQPDDLKSPAISGHRKLTPSQSDSTTTDATTTLVNSFNHDPHESKRGSLQQPHQQSNQQPQQHLHEQQRLQPDSDFLGQFESRPPQENPPQSQGNQNTNQYHGHYPQPLTRNVDSISEQFQNSIPNSSELGQGMTPPIRDYNLISPCPQEIDAIQGAEYGNTPSDPFNISPQYSADNTAGPEAWSASPFDFHRNST